MLYYIFLANHKARFTTATHGWPDIHEKRTPDVSYRSTALFHRLRSWRHLRRSRRTSGAQKFHDISSRCHPEQSEGSMHSACGIGEWPTLQRFSTVILSAADTSQSEVPAESKDPYPSVAAPERKGILTARPHPRGCVWDFGRTQEAATYILRRDRLPIRSNRTSTTQHVNRALAG